MFLPNDNLIHFGSKYIDKGTFPLDFFVYFTDINSSSLFHILINFSVFCFIQILCRAGQRYEIILNYEYSSEYVM